MPLNCPRDVLDYNACLGCRNRHENQCWANLPVSQKLADILTLDERISLLEDKTQFLEVIEPIKVEHIYHHINPQTGLVYYLRDKVKVLLALQEKIESHISRTVGKKGKFKVYK